LSFIFLSNTTIYKLTRISLHNWVETQQVTKADAAA
jgi:hypothetical protein